MDPIRWHGLGQSFGHLPSGSQLPNTASSGMPSGYDIPSMTQLGFPQGISPLSMPDLAGQCPMSQEQMIGGNLGQSTSGLESLTSLHSPYKSVPVGQPAFSLESPGHMNPSFSRHPYAEVEAAARSLSYSTDVKGSLNDQKADLGLPDDLSKSWALSGGGGLLHNSTLQFPSSSSVHEGIKYPASNQPHSQALPVHSQHNVIHRDQHMDKSVGMYGDAGLYKHELAPSLSLDMKYGFGDKQPQPYSDHSSGVYQSPPISTGLPSLNLLSPSSSNASSHVSLFGQQKGLSSSQELLGSMSSLSQPRSEVIRSGFLSPEVETKNKTPTKPVIPVPVSQELPQNNFPLPQPNRSVPPSPNIKEDTGPFLPQMSPAKSEYSPFTSQIRTPSGQSFDHILGQTGVRPQESSIRNISQELNQILDRADFDADRAGVSLSNDEQDFQTLLASTDFEQDPEPAISSDQDINNLPSSMKFEEESLPGPEPRPETQELKTPPEIAPESETKTETATDDSPANKPGDSVLINEKETEDLVSSENVVSSEADDSQDSTNRQVKCTLVETKSMLKIKLDRGVVENFKAQKQETTEDLIKSDQDEEYTPGRSVARTSRRGRGGKKKRGGRVGRPPKQPKKEEASTADLIAEADRRAQENPGLQADMFGLESVEHGLPDFERDSSWFSVRMYGGGPKTKAEQKQMTFKPSKVTVAAVDDDDDEFAHLSAPPDVTAFPPVVEKKAISDDEFAGLDECVVEDTTRVAAKPKAEIKPAFDASFQSSFLSFIQGDKQETLDSVTNSHVDRKPILPKYVPEPQKPKQVFRRVNKPKEIKNPIDSEVAKERASPKLVSGTVSHSTAPSSVEFSDDEASVDSNLQTQGLSKTVESVISSLGKDDSSEVSSNPPSVNPGASLESKEEGMERPNGVVAPSNGENTREQIVEKAEHFTPRGRGKGKRGGTARRGRKPKNHHLHWKKFESSTASSDSENFEMEVEEIKEERPVIEEVESDGEGIPTATTTPVRRSARKASNKMREHTVNLLEESIDIKKALKDEVEVAMSTESDVESIHEADSDSDPSWMPQGHGPVSRRLRASSDSDEDRREKNRVKRMRGSGHRGREKMKKRSSFDVAFKCQVVEHARKSGSNRKTAKHYGIDERQVRMWSKQTEQFEKSKSSAKRLKGGGRRVHDKELELSLMDWVITKRKKGIPISGRALMQQARHLSTDSSFKASPTWLRRFKSRHGLGGDNMRFTWDEQFGVSDGDRDDNKDLIKKLALKDQELISKAAQQRNEQMPQDQQEQNQKSPNNQDVKREVSDEESTRPSEKSKRGSYDIAFKRQVVQHAKTSGSNRKTAKIFGICERQVRVWSKQVDKFDEMENSAKRVKGAGRRVQNDELEAALVEWVIAKRRQGIPIKGTQLKLQAHLMSKDPSFRASSGWLNRFRIRHGLTVSKLRRTWNEETAANMDVKAKEQTNRGRGRGRGHTVTHAVQPSPIQTEQTEEVKRKAIVGTPIPVAIVNKPGTPGPSSTHTTDNEEVSEILDGDESNPVHNYQKGDFLIEKAEIEKRSDDEPFPIWRIDSANLIQKFDPFIKEGKTLHKASAMYSNWALKFKNKYITTKIHIVDCTRKKEVVELRSSLRPVGKIDEELEAKPVMQSFNILIQAMLSQALDSRFLKTAREAEEQYLLDPLKEFEKIIEEGKEKAIANIQLVADFKKKLEMYPHLTEYARTHTTIMCRVTMNPVDSIEKLIKLHGKSYDPSSFQETDENKHIGLEFLVSRKAAHCSKTYHNLHHFFYHSFLKSKDKMQILQRKDPDIQGTELVEMALKDRLWVQEQLRNFDRLVKDSGMESVTS